MARASCKSLAVSRRRAKASRAGFTLIEMLAVVAILAIVASVVLPNLGGIRHRALRNEAQQIAAQLEHTRRWGAELVVPIPGVEVLARPEQP